MHKIEHHASVAPLQNDKSDDCWWHLSMCLLSICLFVYLPICLSAFCMNLCICVLPSICPVTILTGTCFRPYLNFRFWAGVIEKSRADFFRQSAPARKHKCIIKNSKAIRLGIMNIFWLFFVIFKSVFQTNVNYRNNKVNYHQTL